MRRVGATVPIEECQRRALEYMSRSRPANLFKASQIGYAIWPEGNFKAQGAGAAGSRILRRLVKTGEVSWEVTESDWGYRLTAAGRNAVAGRGLDLPAAIMDAIGEGRGLTMLSKKKHNSAKTLARSMHISQAPTRPNDGIEAEERSRALEKKLNLTPMSDIDLMIQNGWGDTPQIQLPADWRTTKQR